MANGDPTYRPVLKKSRTTGELADTPDPGTTPSAPPVDWQKRAKRQRQRSAMADEVQRQGRQLNQAGTRSLFEQAGSILGQRSVDTPNQPRYMDVEAFRVPGFKRGGTMRKSGVARLHKGERIVSRKRGRKGRGRSR